MQPSAKSMTWPAAAVRAAPQAAVGDRPRLVGALTHAKWVEVGTR